MEPQNMTKHQHAPPHLSNFAPMMEDEVNKVIMSMKTKHCKVDTLPTSLLKLLVPSYLPVIAEIVHISLETRPVL